MIARSRTNVATPVLDVGVLGACDAAVEGKVLRYPDALSANSHSGMLLVGSAARGSSAITALAQSAQGRCLVLQVCDGPRAELELPFELAADKVQAVVQAARAVVGDRTLPVQLLGRCTGIDGKKMLVNVLAIGCASLVVEAPEPPPLGENVEIHFIIPGTSERIGLSGLVTVNPQGLAGTRAIDVRASAAGYLQMLQGFVDRRLEQRENGRHG